MHLRHLPTSLNDVSIYVLRPYPQDDVLQGGLARPGAAGESQGSAHRDGGVDVPERRCRSMRVGKGDTPQADLSLGQEGMGGRAVDLCQRGSVAEILIYGVHGG